MEEPRRPFLRVFSVGQAQYTNAKKISDSVSLIPPGSFMFTAVLQWVLDWDGVWWEFNPEFLFRHLWPWTKWTVRRNLLLTPIEDPATVSLAETSNGDKNESDGTDQQRKGS